MCVRGGRVRHVTSSKPCPRTQEAYHQTGSHSKNSCIIHLFTLSSRASCILHMYLSTSPCVVHTASQHNCSQMSSEKTGVSIFLAWRCSYIALPKESQRSLLVTNVIKVILTTRNIDKLQNEYQCQLFSNSYTLSKAFQLS